jgi:Secretion system C-terminal sorting domain
MKHLYSSFLIALVLVFTNQATAQNTCSTPYAFTTGSTSTYSAPIGYPNMDGSNNYGCLGTGINNATWLYLGVCTGGNIDLNLSCSSTDVNFIVWGPLTAATDCGLTAGQIVDCSTASVPTESFTIPATVVGQYYKIMITNNSGAAGYFSLTQNVLGGAGTACDSTSFICPGPAPIQQICQVTTDPALNHNIIIWNKDTAYHGPYIIQKETTTMGLYTTIGTALNTDTSAYEDMVSNPMIQSFKYRIGTTDTCGSVTSFGYPHETIHLLTSISSATGYPQLDWNNYIGFGYGTYFIYRGASPTTLTMYDSISASFNSYTDVAAVPGMNYYGVAVFPPSPCHPSRMMTMKSLSNVSPVAYTGINEHEFANLSIGPNPANDVLNFTLQNVSADITIDIVDITGRLVFSKIFKNVSQDIIKVSDISNGSYIVRFTSESGTTHKNIIIAR